MVAPRSTIHGRREGPGDLDVEANLREYLKARGPTDRYASFDYCFNYFQEHREAGRARDLAGPALLQQSCLQLGFYLASWGMYRGSTVLLQRSVRHLVPVIEAIAHSPDSAWDIDANGYSSEAIDVLLDIDRRIRAALHETATDTLITKIMLGVFGSVPAFDAYFRAGSGWRSFTRSTLAAIGSFCRENAEVIDRFLVPTLDFASGRETTRRYTRAKVIDMAFFIEGGGSAIEDVQPLQADLDGAGARRAFAILPPSVLDQRPSVVRKESRVGKYERLTEHLRQLSPPVSMTFSQLDSVVGGLPPSARLHREWWANHRGNPQARGWMEAGLRVDVISLSRETVEFRR